MVVGVIDQVPSVRQVNCAEPVVGVTESFADPVDPNGVALIDPSQLFPFASHFIG